MRKWVKHQFKEGKVYLVQHRCDRYFFEVMSRTAQTATVKLRGYQENYADYRPIPMLPPNDDQLQKIRLHVDKDTDSEYGYVTVNYSFWGTTIQSKVAIDGRSMVDHLI